MERISSSSSFQFGNTVPFQARSPKQPSTPGGLLGSRPLPSPQFGWASFNHHSMDQNAIDHLPPSDMSTLLKSRLGNINWWSDIQDDDTGKLKKRTGRDGLPPLIGPGHYVTMERMMGQDINSKHPDQAIEFSEIPEAYRTNHPEIFMKGILPDYNWSVLVSEDTAPNHLKHQTLMAAPANLYQSIWNSYEEVVQTMKAYKEEHPLDYSLVNTYQQPDNPPCNEDPILWSVARLAHFVADLHQPLHLTAYNSWKMHPSGVETKFFKMFQKIDFKDVPQTIPFFSDFHRFMELNVDPDIGNIPSWNQDFKKRHPDITPRYLPPAELQAQLRYSLVDSYSQLGELMSIYKHSRSGFPKVLAFVRLKSDLRKFIDDQMDKASILIMDLLYSAQVEAGYLPKPAPRQTKD